jgi:large subunit ribosomal protein L2
VPARVAAIEYDPNRTSYIALLHYVDGAKAYILAPNRLRVGHGRRLGPGRRHHRRQRAAAVEHPARAPSSTTSSSSPGRGGQMARSAGAGVQLMAKEGDMATLRLPRRDAPGPRGVPRDRRHVGNADHQNVKIGKAGRKRHMGVRPQTRGTAMNPVDHPHGGGEGSTTPAGTRSRPGACRRWATARARRTRRRTATSSAVAAWEGQALA